MMKNLKLFTKTYIFTMVFMTIIIFISHTMLFLLLPKFYINKKEEELSKLSTVLWKKVEGRTEETIIQVAEVFAKTNNVNILLQIEGNTYTFHGYSPVNIYMDPLFETQDSTIISNDETNRVENPSNINEHVYDSLSDNAMIHHEGFQSSTGKKGFFQITMTLQPVEEARNVVFMILPYSIGMSMFLSLLAAYIYAKAITNPIKRICEATKQMETLEKGAYCKVRSNDEIGQLAENVNHLYETLWNTIYSLEKEIDNVSASEKRKVDFLRSASHELKTPLMSLHIMVENMLYNVGKYKNHDVYLKKCQDILQDLSHMIQEILDTSGLNRWKEHREEEVIDGKDIIREVVEPYLIIMKSKHIHINDDGLDSFLIKVDKKMLRKVFSNILSNAVHYTDEGKCIRIYHKNTSLIIENDCTPIEPQHLEHIFEAFYRPYFDRNKHSGGNGLGLYIVDQILTLSNIPYSFEPIETGMRFMLDFQHKTI